MERRRSLYHSAAVIFSPSPRRIEPCLARALAEVGLGDVPRDAALDLGLEGDAELAGDLLELDDLVVGQAGGAVAEPGADDAVVAGAVEADQEHDIIGAAGRAKLLQDIKIQQRGIAGQPASQDRQPVGQGVAHGASQELVPATLLGTIEFDDDALLCGPIERARIIKRVEDAESHPAVKDGDADAAQPLAQLAIERGGVGILQGLARQPLDDGAGQDLRRCGLLVRGQACLRFSRLRQKWRAPCRRSDVAPKTFERRVMRLTSSASGASRDESRYGR